MNDRTPRPDDARVTMDMVGSASEPTCVRWTQRDTMLYALGVGAGLGRPGRELAFTTENSSGVTLRALPSFLTILTAGPKPPALRMLDVGRFLHAEQSIELFGALPTSGEATLISEVGEVLDKGSGAIVTIVSTLTTIDDGRLIGRDRRSIFVRGAGGFGGPRGTSPAPTDTADPPDARIVTATRPEQALLYRLSGDRHPLHSDPFYASKRGFDRPILHGLCTYGFACRAVIEAAAGNDPAGIKSLSATFRKPVYPGDTLTTEIWFIGDRISFQMLDGAGDAVVTGTATLTG